MLIGVVFHTFFSDDTSLNVDVVDLLANTFFAFSVQNKRSFFWTDDVVLISNNSSVVLHGVAEISFSSNPRQMGEDIGN